MIKSSLECLIFIILSNSSHFIGFSLNMKRKNNKNFSNPARNCEILLKCIYVGGIAVIFILFISSINQLLIN